MTGKGRFLYILPSEDGYRALVKKSDFSDYPEGTTFSLDHGVGLPLSKMCTDDLFKVKAQIASELENRMDLDEVVEANLDKLKEKIKDADTKVIAQLLRQTLDRLEVVGQDEKRAKARQQILEDELCFRMKNDGVNEMKFEKAITATYKKEMVYNVGEEGWDSVYGGIVSSAIAGEKDKLAQSIASVLFNYGLEDSVDDTFFSNVVLDTVIHELKTKFTAVDAFSFLQKRLTSTSLNELVKQGEALPQGIVSQEISKLKIRRSK